MKQLGPPPADCVVNAMPGRRRLLESRAPVAYVTYGAALFDSCAFVDTGLMASEAVYTSDYDYNGWTASSGGLEVHGENATLALRKCTFTDTVAEPPVVASSLASFFSDSPGLLVRRRCHVIPSAVMVSRLDAGAGTVCLHVCVQRVSIVSLALRMSASRSCNNVLHNRAGSVAL